jgi:hypothetical protein
MGSPGGTFCKIREIARIAQQGAAELEGGTFVSDQNVRLSRLSSRLLLLGRLRRTNMISKHLHNRDSGGEPKTEWKPGAGFPWRPFLAAWLMRRLPVSGGGHTVWAAPASGKSRQHRQQCIAVAAHNGGHALFPAAVHRLILGRLAGIAFGVDGIKVCQLSYLWDYPVARTDKLARTRGREWRASFGMRRPLGR